VIVGPNIIDEAKATVHHIQDNFNSVKSHQERYRNKRHHPFEFEVGNHIYLRVSPMKGVKRVGVRGKLAPHYIRPFPIIDKCWPVAYKLNLPPLLVGVHGIFHVLQLKKFMKAPLEVVFPEVTPPKAELSYPEHPNKVLDLKDHVTRRKTIKFFKIQWSNHSKKEATWEYEHILRSRHLKFKLP
jgi:hypothetical protein